MDYLSAVFHPFRFCYKWALFPWTVTILLCTSPEAGCYWLRVCYIAMTMVMLDYMPVQSLMITHIANNNL